MMKKLIACLAAGAIAGTAFAKLPAPPPMTDAQKAEKAAKDKATADKNNADLAKAQDKSVAHYKKSKGMADAKQAPAAKKK
jgi:hypothetical protein